MNLNSENSLLAISLCSKSCVLITHHFEKLQLILHLENLETDLNENKLILRYLDKMTRSVQYAGIVGWLVVVS